MKITDKIKELTNCAPDIKELADYIKSYSIKECEDVIEKYIESGESTYLGMFLNACAVNEICINSVVLAKSLKVSEPISDLIYMYKFQDQSAIKPLLEVASGDDISAYRILNAAMIVSELSVCFDTKRKDAERMLNKLSNKYDDSMYQFFLSESFSIINKQKSTLEQEGHIFRIEKNIIDELPETKPNNRIGGSYTVRRAVEKTGRNDPCHCGSGKKYKKCCIEVDKKLLRDSSQYAGITRSEIKQTPDIVDDTGFIETMEPYELKKMIPEKLNEDQLLTAYRQLLYFGFNEKSFLMLLELKKRSGKKIFAEEHMVDLLYDCIETYDQDLAEKVMVQISEEVFKDDELIEFGFFLLKNRSIISELEKNCRKVFDEREFIPDNPFIKLCYHFEKSAPALSVAFGRAAIIGDPDKHLDNHMLIKAIRNARIDLNLEEIEDPVESYYDWFILEEEENLQNEIKQNEIELKNLMADEKLQLAADKIAEAKRKEKALVKSYSNLKQEKAEIQKSIVRDLEPEKASSKQHGRPITELKHRIERLKEEVREQQKKRKHLKCELEKEKTKSMNSNETQDKKSDDFISTGFLPDENLPKTILIPEFSEKFRRKCNDFTPSVVAKALKAVTGFATHDKEIFKNTKKIETASGMYRIKTQQKYRLMLKYKKNKLEVLDLINRKDLERWLKKNGKPLD